MKKINWKVLLISILIVVATAFIGSFFTSQTVDTSWYQETRPSITPPNYVFPIAWNILYFMIALSLYFAWVNLVDKKDKATIIFVFGINFVINILWSWLYFSRTDPLAAFVGLISLWLSIVLMIMITRKINKVSAYLLIPYILWVSFAGVLNYLSI